MYDVKAMPFTTGKMLIGGQLCDSNNGKWLDCQSPSTGEVIGRVPSGSQEDVERAVAAAQESQPKWAGLTVAQRSAYLLNLASALAERADDLLMLEVGNTGNSITGMKGDIAASIERLRYFAGLGYELQGNTIPDSADKLNLTVREPYGVVGRIVAYNHALAMAVHGIASPLVAGNTVVLKPSEQCPLSATLLGEIASKVLPEGVLNIVTGGVDVGSAIVQHPNVKRLSFVGSVRTGLAIQRSAAEVAVKSISLELGGKNPFIVFRDAPIEEVSEAAVLGMNFIWQGQSCSSTSRLFVHDDIYDEVVKQVVSKVEKIRIGDPFDYNTQMGAIITPQHLASIENYVEVGKQEGARLVAGGKRPNDTRFKKGNWFQPTVFSEVRHDMRIAREEIFGPILSILRWSDLDDVLSMANSVEYGLTAAIWTSDIKKALDTAKRIQSGYVWVNGINTHVRAVPFGGYKNSGTGRERGIEELYSYTEEKSIQIFL